MKTTAIIAVVVVVIIAVAAAAIVISNDDDDSKDSNSGSVTPTPATEQNASKNLSALESTLSDMKKNESDYPMLMILGNADWDSDIDNDDVTYIENLIKNGYTYSKEFMADANHDGLIDEKDVAMVKQLMDYNNYADKVNYLNCDYKIRTYDMSRPLHLAGCLTQTFEIECILAPEAIVATDYRCGDPARNQGEGTFWQEFASVIDYDHLGTVGNLKFPVPETIINACKQNGNGDLTVWMNSEYARGTGDLENQVSGTGVQIIRLPSWENGATVNGVLTAGYLFHKFDRATAWADWYNGIMNTIKEKAAAVPEADKKKVLGAYLYTSDEDATSYYVFAGNSGEYQNLLRLGIQDVVTKAEVSSGSGWKVELTDESFAAVCQSFGCDVMVGTVPGPFGSAYMNGSKDVVSHEYIEKIYQERLKGINEYTDGSVKLVVFGWIWATGPMELTFLAEVGNYLYDWGLDVEKITNEGMQWLGIYGESGDYKYTYDSIVDRLWYAGASA